MMNKKSDFDVGAIANLARLELDEKAKEKIQSNLAEIVVYVEELASLNLEGVLPMDHSSDLKNVFREDISTASFPRDSMLANAPETVDSELVKVPAVLPEEEE